MPNVCRGSSYSRLNNIVKEVKVLTNVVKKWTDLTTTHLYKSRMDNIINTSENNELGDCNNLICVNRSSKFAINPEDAKLLGFKENCMVFEDMNPVKKTKSNENQVKKDIILQKVQLASNGKKFLYLEGKKFQIIQPKIFKLQNAPTSKIKGMVVKSDKTVSNIIKTTKKNGTDSLHLNKRNHSSVLVSTAKHDFKSNNTNVLVLNPDSRYIKTNIQASDSPNPASRFVKTNIQTSEILNPDSRYVKTNIQASDIQKISQNTLEKQKNLPKLPQKDEHKRNIMPNNSSLLKIERKTEEGEVINVVSRANNKNSHVIPIKHDLKLNSILKKSDTDRTQFNVLSNVLINPNEMEKNGKCSNCDTKKVQSTTTTSTNTERVTTIDRQMQTEAPFDILADIWDKCLNDKNAEDMIIGSNVNMGNGPPPIHTEDHDEKGNKSAKFLFFNDLQTCLLWDSGNLPIHKGVFEKDLALVKRQCVVLKARNTDINIVNNNNYTPLQLAVIHNVDIEIVRVLLQFNADMSILDPDGNNVLHLAVENNRNDLVGLFLDDIMSSKLNIDQYNYDGVTPLMCCAFHTDRIDIAENLLKKGAQPNLRDLKSGRTAMFHAAENHNTPMVSLLLDYLADTKIRNFFGTSVHDAMFELDDIPKEIKYPILGRDLKLHHRKKWNQGEGAKHQDQLKRRKLEIVPTVQKIGSNTKFIFKN